MQQQSVPDYFRMMLVTVVGQAFDAAGYKLEERPVQWAGGKIRFSRQLDSQRHAHIDFQVLSYTDSEWAPGAESRFRVTLGRSDHIQRTLSELVVQDFGVAILPSADHWWTFANTEELGKALAEAGHLIIGYGIPWLAGDLVPPSG